MTTTTSSSFRFLTQPTFSSNNLSSSQTQTLTREKKEETKHKVLEEIDEKIYELPDPPKLEVGDGLTNVLGAEAGNILEDNFIN